MSTAKKSAAKKAKGADIGKTSERKNIPQNVAIRVLTEAGYRCAVPTCRATLAMDLHHIWQVSAGGQNDPANLIALCPYCHGLHHRGTISAEAIYVYKALLVSLSQAFDLEGIDRLLFLSNVGSTPLIVSGDGVLIFSRLIAAGLAKFSLHADNNGQLVTYALKITKRGRNLIEVWKSGNRGELVKLMSGDGNATIAFMNAIKEVSTTRRSKTLPKEAAKV
jgi:hypothetical protein